MLLLIFCCGTSGWWCPIHFVVVVPESYFKCTHLALYLEIGTCTWSDSFSVCLCICFVVVSQQSKFQNVLTWKRLQKDGASLSECNIFWHVQWMLENAFEVSCCKTVCCPVIHIYPQNIQVSYLHCIKCFLVQFPLRNKTAEKSYRASFIRKRCFETFLKKNVSDLGHYSICTVEAVQIARYTF